MIPYIVSKLKCGGIVRRELYPTVFARQREMVVDALAS
jgi:hypothetical protein